MKMAPWCHDINTTCLACGYSFRGPYPIQCPYCGFSTAALADLGTTSFQVKKLNEHLDILYGRDVQLFNKQFNASFDFNGYSKLQDLVRYGLSYGAQVNLPGRRGVSNTSLIAYVPEIIGTGTAISYPDPVPCSGIIIISPNSTNFGHTAPLIQGWVDSRFGYLESACRYCGRPVSFGLAVCYECYQKLPDGWYSMI